MMGQREYRTLELPTSEFGDYPHLVTRAFGVYRYVDNQYKRVGTVAFTQPGRIEWVVKDMTGLQWDSPTHPLRNMHVSREWYSYARGKMAAVEAAAKLGFFQ